MFFLVDPILGTPNAATVAIVRRWHQGVFEFYEHTFSISDTTSCVICKVRRHTGTYSLNIDFNH